MQSVLILGAGLLQRPSILAAKRLGYKAVVIDANDKALCVPLADEFHKIDLKDKDGILRLGEELMAQDGGDKKRGLAAVFTAGTDFSASVSYAAQKLCLPCHSYEAALNASNKGRMRACFKKNNVPSPEFRLAGDNPGTALEDGIRAISEIGFPCVVKPVDNMGARGCKMVRNASEAAAAVKNAIASSRTGCAIIEEYMDGAEYSIDALVFNGEVTVTGFADRHIYWPPYFIETGHTMPTEADDEKRTALIETFAMGIAALGLTHGAAKADIKWTKNGPMVGEIAARLSGGYMSGWTYPYASGLDLTEQALLIACGRKPDALINGRKSIKTAGTLHHGTHQLPPCPFSLYDYPCTAVCAERAWVSIPGTVAEVKYLSDAAAVKGVRDVFPRVKAGDDVDFPRNNVQKCGNVIAVAPTRQEASYAAKMAAASVIIRLKPHNKRTDDFLAGRIEDKGTGAEAKEMGGGSDESGFPPFAYETGESIMAQVAKLEGVLGAKDKALESIPSCLASIALSDERDFNRRTLKETLLLFDKLCSGRARNIKANVFWSAVLRGGLQGAMYTAE